MHQKNITNFLQNKVRITAKKLKNQYPSASYNQRLNIASQQLCGMKNYHELTKHHKNYLEKIRLPENEREHTCPYCHMIFSPDIEGEIEEHERNHRKWEVVEFSLGYLPCSYPQREKLKKLAYEKIHDEDDFDIKLQGAIELIRAHYDRSLDAAIDGEYWKEHPSFEEFISMSDYSNILPSDLVEGLIKKYGKNTDGIAVEKSYWFPSTY